jgi:hypothetical protein
MLQDESVLQTAYNMPTYVLCDDVKNAFRNGRFSGCVNLTGRENMNLSFAAGSSMPAYALNFTVQGWRYARFVVKNGEVFVEKPTAL